VRTKVGPNCIVAYGAYTGFGDAEGASFSAWTYARERCDEMCGKSAIP